MNMNRIILIGNGFDLAHGLPTSYQQFVRWYCDQRINAFVGNITDTSSDLLCSFQDLRGQVWNVNAFNNGYNLHNACGKDIIDHLIKDKKFFKTTMAPFFKNIYQSIETKGWVDIENEYYNLLVKYAIKENSKENLSELNQQLQYIQGLLIQYLSLVCRNCPQTIGSIARKIYEPIKTSDIAIGSSQALLDHIDMWMKQDEAWANNKIARYGLDGAEYLQEITNYKQFRNSNYPLLGEFPRLYMLPDSILLLNFNYTPTDCLYINKNVCGVTHIHGELEKPQSIIFGYGDEQDKNYEPLKDLNDNDCLCNMKTSKYLESDNYRNALSFLDYAPFQVYIMGHSCGNSDRTLLNTIFEHKNCISIKPYYYVKEDGTDNYLELIQNISRNFTDMKLMRDRVVNKTYCEPLVSNN